MIRGGKSINWCKRGVPYSCTFKSDTFRPGGLGGGGPVSTVNFLRDRRTVFVVLAIVGVFVFLGVMK